MLWNGRSFHEGLGGVPITHHHDSSVASKTGLLTHTRPSPPPQSSPPLPTHAAYHQTPCLLTHGFTGVFHNTSLGLNHWHSTPLWIACFLLSLFSHTFLHNVLQRSLSPTVFLSLIIESPINAFYGSLSPWFFPSIPLPDHANYFCQGVDEWVGWEWDKRQLASLRSQSNPNKWLLYFHVCNC